MVDANISNKALSHDRNNVFPGLSYNKANTTFLTKVLERARVSQLSREESNIITMRNLREQTK